MKGKALIQCTSFGLVLQYTGPHTIMTHDLFWTRVMSVLCLGYRSNGHKPNKPTPRTKQCTQLHKPNPSMNTRKTYPPLPFGVMQQGNR